MRKLSIVILLLAALLSTIAVHASTHTSVEDIIAGKQDKLVLATVSKVGADVCTVYVVDEIGEETDNKNADSENNKATESEKDGEQESRSLVGTEIEVAGFDSYMYFDDLQYPIQIGHNVLLSLTFKGNVYHIKNGAFHINSATHDRNELKFIAPEGVDGEEAAMELTALYYFITSDGRNADYVIKGSTVMTHDANTGEAISINEQTGITFINDQGETTKDISINDSQDEGKSSVFETFKWILSIIILIIAFLTGPLAAKLVKKIEKRSESK